MLRFSTVVLIQARSEATLGIVEASERHSWYCLIIPEESLSSLRFSDKQAQVLCRRCEVTGHQLYLSYFSLGGAVKSPISDIYGISFITTTVRFHIFSIFFIRNFCNT